MPNMFKIIFLVLLAAIIGCTHGQITKPGPCRDIPIILNHFEVERYLGTWYELRRYPRFDIPIASQDCATQEFSPSESPNKLNVINSGTDLDSMYHVRMEGYALLSFPDEVPLPAMLNVTFADNPSRINYRIIYTDYTNYSVVWYCVDGDDGTYSLEFSWILSRRSTIVGDAREEVDAIVYRFFNEHAYIDVVQDQAVCLGEDVQPA